MGAVTCALLGGTIARAALNKCTQEWQRGRDKPCTIREILGVGYRVYHGYLMTFERLDGAS